MPAYSPAPVEFLNYLPASDQLAQHTISDGPYMVQSYVPAKTIDFVRNPVWNANDDPVRKAYVDKINVSMTGNQQSIQQQIVTNTRGRGHGLGHRRAHGGHSRPAGQQGPEAHPRGHLRHQSVHRLQRGVAQQRRRPGQTSRSARPSSTGSTATISSRITADPSSRRRSPTSCRRASSAPSRSIPTRSTIRRPSSC